MRAGADWLGFVLVPASPRAVTASQAAALADGVRRRTKLVVLLADPDDGALGAVLETVRPDAIQLHGGETPDRVASVKTRAGAVEVWKAFPVSEAADLDVAATYGAADRWLFDARAPAGADRRGGHGASFDWTLLAGRRFDRPWFLAGGLTPGNVAEAVSETGAEAVDVSSGVESAPGVKDASLIVRFVEAARETG